MTLTISIPSDAESTLRERAAAVGQDLTRYVEGLLVRDAAEPEKPADNGTSLDDQYERGYQAIPEDVSDIAALLPHLAVDAGEWE